MSNMVRRIFFLFIVFVLCLTAISCGKNVGGQSEAGVKETVGETKLETEAETKVEQAEENMVKITFDGTNIREKIVEYMIEMASVEWTPKTDFSLRGDHNTWGVNLDFKAGTSYRGLPYTRAFSDLSGFEEYIQNGIYTGPCGDYNTMPGNNCSAACDVSWRRYLNCTAEATYTYVPGYGNKTMTAVGEYKYIEKNRDTSKIIAANDREVMYQAFASCEIADAIVKWLDSNSAGHARMISAEPVVTRNNYGKINGSRSYLTVVEQTNKLTEENGVWSTWLVHKKYTFDELLKDSYIPVTPVVFANGKTETPYVSYTDGNTAENITSSLMGVVESNYRIYTIELLIRDEDGKDVKQLSIPVELGSNKINLRKYTFNFDINSLPAGKYTYKLSADLGFTGSAELCSITFEKQ